MQLNGSDFDVSYSVGFDSTYLRDNGGFNQFDANEQTYIAEIVCTGSTTTIYKYNYAIGEGAIVDDTTGRVAVATLTGNFGRISKIGVNINQNPGGLWVGLAGNLYFYSKIYFPTDGWALLPQPVKRTNPGDSLSSTPPVETDLGDVMWVEQVPIVPGGKLVVMCYVSANITVDVEIPVVIDIVGTMNG